MPVVYYPADQLHEKLLAQLFSLLCFGKPPPLFKTYSRAFTFHYRGAAFPEGAIFYNPSSILSVTSVTPRLAWVAWVGFLGHEIWHNTSQARKPVWVSGYWMDQGERGGDFFSGMVLRRFGASREEAGAYARLLESISRPDGVHGPGDVRAADVLRGYDRAPSILHLVG